MSRRGPTAVPGLLAVLLLGAAACAGSPGLAPEERAGLRCRAVQAAPAPHLPGASTAVTTPPPAVRWTVFGDSAGRATLDAWCAAVGPALVRDGTDRGSGDDARELVVVAWNMGRGSGDLRRLLADLQAGALTGGRSVRSFVLLLQEAPRMGHAVPPASALPAGAATSSARQVQGPALPEIAEEAGLHLFYVPSMRADPDGAAATDHGTAILSSLPLGGHHVIELPMAIQRRVAAAATVHVPGGGGSVRLVTAHLDNFSFRRLRGSLGGVRARQARALAATLPDAEPVVLGADLNTWARELGEEAFTVLRRELPQPPVVSREATSRFLFVPRRVDYLLARVPAGWTFTERRIPDRYGSDHHPLVGVLKPLADSQLR